MRIELTRSGGFAGITMRASVDTADLAPTEAAMIELPVQGVDLPRPEGTTSVSAINVDRFHYDLTGTSGEERHQLSAGETELSPALCQLLDALLRRR